MIALALSGGGARAMAFHLGCFRALHDRGILDHVQAISSVSGGSVLAACWAYRGEDFDAFDKHVVEVLRRGIQGDIVREVFGSLEGLKIIATLLFTGTLSSLIWVLKFTTSRLRLFLGIPTLPLERALQAAVHVLPVWGSLTTAFEAGLSRRLFGDTTVDRVRRPNLAVIINACDLTTGTAFRFGSGRSGGWRFGDVQGAAPTVAKAVAASAAFPILLPPLIETFEFEKKGERHSHTVALTDGGVFDNLGVAVLEPGRAHDHAQIEPVTHLITLNAGGGQFDVSRSHPYWWVGRVARSFEAVHRKAQDAVYQRLHKYAEVGDLQAFGMIYLGQQDDKLPWAPADLVKRAQVKDYPTDFSPMSEENIRLLTSRGEQLTHIIVERYLSDLTN
ncbi:patatin-like phospholipase family protein [Rhizobium oryzicola]|uniref:Patatin-like phospholipase family protein n=1 Tax=Rhizobium oryzicola TaxID=1232668 RepID=A0ABT8T914_9HYPH|nr:patatin-like phospholipase family protein [Rhizobium oryzicola]MDO1585607.1 patatin-like phospholipase family protein [Rhizobium oryzicola]